MLGFTDQQMQDIEWADIGPHRWQPEALPDVDDVRPHHCSRCGSPAKEGGRVVLHGHGHRGREVVIHPAVGDSAELVVECWSRRYRCTRCGAVPTVLPPGVLPRFLYSALAIVTAFWLVEAAPVGQGLTEAEAYAVQGMYRCPRWTKPWPYRWRSLDRWRARWISGQRNQRSRGPSPVVAAWCPAPTGLQLFRRKCPFPRDVSPPSG